MITQENILKYLYEEYLKRYIDYLTKNQDIFQISICDIEFEIIDMLKDFSYKDIRITSISKLDYSQAVEFRNNLSISKIVIISPISVKKIDSLKDFNEYTVFPNIQSKDEWFWEIIEIIFALNKGATKNYRKYISTIIQEKEINLTQLLEYISQCIINKTISTELLNKNLYLVSCWKSNTKETIKPAELKKLIRLSNPAEIEKRISNIVANDIKVDNIQYFNKIKKLVFKNDFENLFRNYYYEDMPEQFISKPPKLKRERPISESELPISKYIFSYDAFIEEGHEPDVLKFEEALLNGDNDLELCESVINSFNKYMDSYNVDSDLKKIENIIELVQDKININPNAKNELLAVLHDFKSITQKTLKYIKEMKIYPIYLFSFCNITKSFYETYFKLLSLTLRNENIFKAFSKNIIIENIQNLFTIFDGSSVNMSFFHPVAVYYYKSLKNKYEEVLVDIKNCDNEILEMVLKDLISKNENKFPIKFLFNKGDKFILSNSSFDTYTNFKFSRKNQLSNNTVIDARIISNKIKEYILKFPYRSEINAIIVGNVSFENIETLYKTVSRLIDKEECLLRKLQINILTEEDKKLKDSLEQLKENGYINEAIQYSFSKYKYLHDGVIDFVRIIDNADILFLLDCELVYENDEFKNVENQNEIIYSIDTLKYDKWIDEFAIGKSNMIGTIWDTMHNILINGKRDLSNWNTNALDNNITNVIKEKTTEKKELMVLLLTSNLRAAEEIFMGKGYLASIIKNYIGELLVLTFSSYIDSSSLEGNEDFSKCYCSLKSILDSVLDNSQIKEIVDFIHSEYETNTEVLENFKYEFIYKHSSNDLKIRCISIEALVEYDEQNDKNTVNKKFEEISTAIFQFAFNGNSNLSRVFKEIIIGLLYSSIESYGDALLVNYIASYYTFNKNDMYFETEEISGQAIRLIRNFVELRNIITYIEKHYKVDPKFRTVYKNKYDVLHLENLLKRAQKMPLTDTRFIEKMQYILKGD